MAIKTSGKALGKLFGKMNTIGFWANSIAQSLVSKYVINPAGRKVTATLKAHLHHDEHGEQPISQVYHCSDGHEYFELNGKHYWHDLSTDTWYDQTHG